MQIMPNFDYNPSRQNCRPDIAILQTHIQNRKRPKAHFCFPPALLQVNPPAVYLAKAGK